MSIDTKEIAPERSWKNSAPLIRLLARKFYVCHSGRAAAAGVELSDLEQEGYFAFIAATKAYDTGSGYMFNTYLTRQCLKRFYNICGMRKRDTL